MIVPVVYIVAPMTDAGRASGAAIAASLLTVRATARQLYEMGFAPMGPHLDELAAYNMQIDAQKLWATHCSKVLKADIVLRVGGACVEADALCAMAVDAHIEVVKSLKEIAAKFERDPL